MPRACFFDSAQRKIRMEPVAKHGIDNAKERGVRADAKRQCRGDGHGEQLVLAQPAERPPEILGHTVELVYTCRNRVKIDWSECGAALF